jgi:hypothetical protein
MTSPLKRILVVIALLLPLVAGCSLKIGGDPSPGGLPQCTGVAGQRADEFGPGIVLIAQSVPSATQLPCIRALPVGWTYRKLDATDDRARFWLDSDRDGDQALQVSLTKTCDTKGATESASTRPGIRRYDRVEVVDSGYRGDRFFVFDGGCVTYNVNLRGSTGAEPLNALLAALDFVSRAAVARHIHEYSDGRFELDASQQAGGSR